MSESACRYTRLLDKFPDAGGFGLPRGRRVAWLYASASLAGSFSGLLAFAIAKMGVLQCFLGLIVQRTEILVVKRRCGRTKWMAVDVSQKYSG